MERYKKIAFVNFIIFVALFTPSFSLGKTASESLSITDVRLIREDEKIALNIYLKGPFHDCRIFTLNDPTRIVIDIFRANLKAILPREIDQIDLSPLKKVRAEIHKEKVRFVMDFLIEKTPAYSIVKGKDQLSIIIKREIVKPLEQEARPLEDALSLPYLPLEKQIAPFDSKQGEGLTQDAPDKEGPELAPAEDLKREISANERETEKEGESNSEGDRQLTWVKNDFKLGLKGYYKNLALISKTVDNDRYFLDLNRFRLDLTGNWKETFVLKIIYDQEGLLGSYLRTNEFQRIKSFEKHDLLDLDWELVDRKDFYWHHYLYRAYLQFQSEKFNFSMGRQRIAWGTGKFWNPTDIFNPFNPIQVERDERMGVDSIDAEFFIKPMTGINLVYTPQDSSSRSKGALKFKTTYKDLDFSLLGGKSLKDKVVGGDFATTIFDGGFRGETIYYFAHRRKNYLQFILNYDYTFKNSFYFLVEYLYNSGPLSKSEFLQLIDRGNSTLTKHLIGLNLGYDITPLFRGDLNLIYGPERNGVFIHPKLRYSLKQNIEVVGGMQWFNQRKGSEFEFDRNLYFINIQYYF